MHAAAEVSCVSAEIVNFLFLCSTHFYCSRMRQTQLVWMRRFRQQKQLLQNWSLMMVSFKRRVIEVLFRSKLSSWSVCMEWESTPSVCWPVGTSDILTRIFSYFVAISSIFVFKPETCDSTFCKFVEILTTADVTLKISSTLAANPASRTLNLSTSSELQQVASSPLSRATSRPKSPFSLASINVFNFSSLKDSLPWTETSHCILGQTFSTSFPILWCCSEICFLYYTNGSKVTLTKWLIALFHIHTQSIFPTVIKWV